MDPTPGPPEPRPLRLLFAPETFNLGETSRGVEVARAARDAGHNVLFMGYSHRFAGRIREAGFDLRLLSPELSDDDADLLIAADQGRSRQHPFTTAMVRHRVESELDLITGWQPDAVVIGSTLTMFISARAARVPLVYVRPYPLSAGHLASMTSFPLLSGNGCVSSLANRAAARGVRSILSSLRWKPASFRTVAAEQGVALPSRTVDLLEADLNVIASVFPLIDDRQLAGAEVVAGPIFARSREALPAELHGLAGRSRPAVYVGLGSSANRSLAVAVLDQITRLDVDVVTSAGQYLTQVDRRNLPPSVQVFDFLPAHRLAGLIDASVTHGGEGTVQTACASGAPFAGIPLQTEQHFNIEDCVRYGNAHRFTSRDLRKGRLPGIVEDLLTDPFLRRRAASMAERMAECDGASTAVRQIAALAPSQR